MVGPCSAPCNEFRFRLNGQDTRVSDAAPQTTLLEYVRAKGFTGAKEGCAEGECGACAVLLVCSNQNSETIYRSVNSCLVPLPAIADREIFTVESLAQNGKLSEVQLAMSIGAGSQCGYCTPGFVVSMFAEQYRAAPEHRDLHSLGGNLCRCTGYRPIGDALRSLGPAPDGFFKARLSRPAPAMQPLRYASHRSRFSRPASLAEALSIAAEDPNAEYVAGNTDLGVLTNLRGERFPHLIGLDAVPELQAFRDSANAVEIGAGLTLTDIGEVWADAPEAFREWLKLFASVPIKNRATLGGNLATASPVGDSAPFLLAMNASVAIASSGGEREVPLSGFFRGYRKTVLNHGEILRAIRIPKPFPARMCFFKVAKRSLDDISTVAAAIACGADSTMRVGLGGVAATPVVFEAPDSAMLARALREQLKPLSDHRGSAEYRLAMCQSLIAKFDAGRGV